MPNQPVRAHLYRLAFTLLRLAIDRRKETRHESKPKRAARPQRQVRAAMQRLQSPSSDGGRPGQ